MALLGTLVDDFTTKDTAKWGFSTGADVTGGQAVIVPSTGYPAVFALTSYDLTGSSAFMQMVSPTNVGAGTTNTFFGVTSSAANNRAQIYWSNGSLFASWFDASNVETELANTTYSSTAHRWWRFSEAGGTLYFHTSPDAATWTQLASVSTATTGITVTSVIPSFGAGYFGTEPSPGAATFDNFNVPPPATLRVPIQTIRVP